LYDEHGRRLYRYALLILGDTSAAEDAVQETFYHLARRARRDASAVTFSYASRAVRNECYSMLRRRRVRRHADVVLLVTLAADATEDERLIVEQALTMLPVEQREVIFLKAFEGLTFQEIADVCAISLNTAASRYRYALDTLRRVLAPSGNAHDK
jgi:RNA polymerase sigma-70 factor (ECF subfamily)